MTRIFCRRCCSYVITDDHLTGDEIFERHMLTAHADDIPDIDPNTEASLPDIDDDDIDPFR